MDSASSKKFALLQQVKGALLSAEAGATTGTGTGAEQALEAAMAAVRKEVGISMDGDVVCAKYSSQGSATSPAALAGGVAMDTEEEKRESDGDEDRNAELFSQDLDEVRRGGDFQGSEAQIEVLREILRSV